MNVHAPSMEPLEGRAAQATLEFARGGGRTFLRRQEVRYPFHVTKPFSLDPGCPSLATLYLQSASGGLYRGDRLGLAIVARLGAMVHVTSQAATIVHATRGVGARQHTQVEVGSDAFVALTLDPLVLFPDADLFSTTEVSLATGARAIVADGYATHDPFGGAPFRRLTTRTKIMSAESKLLCTDAGTITGEAFCAHSSPLGPYRAMGTVMILGECAQDLEPNAMERALQAMGCLAGLSRLPNACGFVVRLLAPDGGTLARALDVANELAMTASIGVLPARRRK